MKTEFKHIKFKKCHDTGKTSRWACYNNSDAMPYLGSVQWYSSWRQYCFLPADETVFSGGCLDDITTFMKELRAFELEERKK